MRLLSYTTSRGRDFGVLKGDSIVSLAARSGYRDLKALLVAGALGDTAAMTEGMEGDVRLCDVVLLPPIPQPSKIICVGLNFRKHIEETIYDEAPFPTLIPRFPNTLTASGQALIRPCNSTAFDFEGELAVVIGRRARHVREEDALAYVAGYSCFNDASIRDWQFHTTQVTPGKNFEGTGGFGPWIVTPDELPALATLGVQTRLNGEVMQEAGFDQMIFPVARLIAYCSAFTTLEPGDVLATGSPSGTGNSRNPKLFMKPGDVVEVEISGVGTLTNPIANEARLADQA